MRKRAKATATRIAHLFEQIRCIPHPLTALKSCEETHRLSATFAFFLLLSFPSSVNQVCPPGGFDPGNGTRFTILDHGAFNDGTNSGPVISYDGGEGDGIVLTAKTAAATIPEHGSLFLLVVGLAGLSRHLQRKKVVEDR